MKVAPGAVPAGRAVVRKRFGRVSSAGVQPSRMLKSLRAVTTRRRDLAQLVGGHVPAGDRREHLRALGPDVGEDAAEELAEDQRVDQRGAVLGLDGEPRGAAPPWRRSALGGEVGLVGARAVVVGAAGADREARGPSSGGRAGRSRAVPAP